LEINQYPFVSSYAVIISAFWLLIFFSFILFALVFKIEGYITKVEEVMNSLNWISFSRNQMAQIKYNNYSSLIMVASCPNNQEIVAIVAKLTHPKLFPEL